MRSKTLTYWITGTILLCGMALTGCQKSEEQKAKETEQAFLNAANTDNVAALKNTLTEQAQRNIKADTMGKSADSFTLENASVHDDTAQVTFVLKEKGGETTPGHFKMRRENGEWRIYAMTVKALPNGGEFTMDFENPAFLSEMFYELGKDIAKALGEGLKAMGEGFKSAGERIQREAEKAQKQSH